MKVRAPTCSLVTSLMGTAVTSHRSFYWQLYLPHKHPRKARRPEERFAGLGCAEETIPDRVG